ncbi:sigma-70 family RNA polymerase sigma factor [Paludisphaera rhizosphaerae]|uniref:sigma-70 family RNA polymerase sigma factor n=1 Tax=Paludisphaera rhizosphaerae TaxID=2711216 RepID=UPI0013EE218D|nr:sigma-70 family RNA polymerase sigma factor [Paludisphaera rhizosphaerae]
MAEAARELSTLFQSGTAIGLTDGEVLRRVARAADDEAETFFRIIVERHGPMVLRVCRGELGNIHDADDAFQATFLVLAHRLREATRFESIGGWLYGVARRVSARARADAARRRSRERSAVRLAVVGEELSEVGHTLAVQEEVGRLPARYREIIVLCFWEGLTQEQAAARLGCPIGTVRSRSARARDLLRRRLARRGLAPEGVETPSPSVPASLALAAARGAAETVAGRSAEGVVGAYAMELAHRLMRSMLMSKLVSTSLVAILAIVASIGLVRAAATQEDRSSVKAKAKDLDDPKRPPASVRTDYIVDPPDLLLVEVLDALEGRPISGERLVRPDGRISLGFYGEVEVADLTIPQVKEKIVLHLKKYLNDEILGLVAMNPETGKLDPIDPKDSDRVFVDVTAYNSKPYYVLGEVAQPGKFPWTGGDKILDAVLYAGGLNSEADGRRVLVVHDKPRPGQAQTEVVDVEGLLKGEENAVNVPIRHGDRVIVNKLKPANPSRPAGVVAAPSPPQPKREQPRREPTAFEIQDQLNRIEERLDALMKKLE